MGKLEGKIAIVTGSGKGIGRDAALAIAAEGATVVTVARTQSDLDETVKMIEDAGGTAISLSRDLTDGEQVADMVKTVVDKYGRIDILVNNAGGYPKEIYKNIEHQAIKIWEWSEEQWDQIIKTNLRIPFLVTKNVVPVMIKQGKGDIVNVSSRMGRIASQMGAYAVAKGGIVTMTKTTAIQTKEYGIKCNAVSPGIVDTPGQRVYNHSVGQDGCPMGSSKDVAKAIIYLLADSPAVMVVVDLQGNKVEGDLNPSSDTATHVELYNRFSNIGGVVHTHSPWATSWAQAGRGIPCYGTTHADYLYGTVPCVRNLTKEEIDEAYEKNTGVLIADRFDEDDLDYVATPAVLCKNHGPFTWGKDAHEAVHNAVVLEEVAKMAARCEMINPDVKPAPQELQDKHYYRKHGANAYYGQPGK